MLMQSMDGHISVDSALQLACRLLPSAVNTPLRYLQLAEELCRCGMPMHLVVCGILLRPIERGIVQSTMLRVMFGDPAAEIAEALDAVKTVPRPSLLPIESTWRLYTLVHRCPEAAVLKIAEMLVQLRHTSDADVRLSTATIGDAAHAAALLGMWSARSELLDARARLSDPRLFASVRTQLEQSLPARITFFAQLREDIQALLKRHEIKATIRRQPQPIYHIANDSPLHVRGQFSWADIVMIVVDTPYDCYRALGAINTHYHIDGARVRDHLGSPKHSGYQALHSAIAVDDPTDSERHAWVALRFMTEAMAIYNADGFLADLRSAPLPEGRPIWWHDRSRWWQAAAGNSKEMVVYTPIGEAIYLPQRATVLDFAVKVHSDLGVFCSGARVSGTRVPPGTPLAWGDVCEVLIDEHSAVDDRLLNLATTSIAKSRIRRAIQRDDNGAQRGRTIFHKVMVHKLNEQEVHASETAIEQQLGTFCRARGYQTVEAYFRAVARGEAAADQIAALVIDSLLLKRLDFEHIPAEARAAARRTRLAQCCNPRPSLPAVAAIVHGGQQIKVHTATCRSIAGTTYPLAWRTADDRLCVAEVLYESWDRPGLIHQVTGAINAVGGINIRNFSADVPETNLARIRFVIEVRDEALVEAVRAALDLLSERRRVEVRTVRIIDKEVQLATALKNPYGPQPVGAWPLFVGRDTQVRQILAHLTGSNGARHILIRGPKRIGKSSLLEHLSQYHLSDFRVPALLNLQGLSNDELAFPALLRRLAEMLRHNVRAQAITALPTLEALAHSPIAVFGEFLRELRGEDGDRFVVLIDELGVVASRHKQYLDEVEFFDQWRTLLNSPAIYNHLAFVMVVPDSSLHRIHGDQILNDPSVPRIGELGQQVRLTLLPPGDAIDLITTPVKTHLEYEQADVDLLLHETGGHPYYTHLVCGQIITAIQAEQRRTGSRAADRQLVPTTIIRQALDNVLANDDAFYHVLRDSSDATRAVLLSVGACSQEGETRVPISWLVGQRRHSERDVALAVEERPDLLKMEDHRVELRVALVAHWLRRHA